MRRIFDALSWFLVITAVSAGVYYTSVKSHAEPSTTDLPGPHRHHDHAGAARAASPDFGASFEAAEPEDASPMRTARVF